MRILSVKDVFRAPWLSSLQADVISKRGVNDKRTGLNKEKSGGLGKVKLSKLGRDGPCGDSRDPVTPALMQTAGCHFSAVHIDLETIV
ncbi:hypothetical protein N7452_003078 [Penicillium brevicompactum]|uniref:Uncharacterized protein n=1 Tax=Penicillium brevicompactum TaxID=5074 RepID=A0A9W9QUD2_PENBR|nr:hypothetical protein N7452_003078 [Penicillium brevicompactum]